MLLIQGGGHGQSRRVGTGTHALPRLQPGPWPRRPARPPGPPPAPRDSEDDSSPHSRAPCRCHAVTIGSLKWDIFTARTYHSSRSHLEESKEARAERLDVRDGDAGRGLKHGRQQLTATIHHLQEKLALQHIRLLLLEPLGCSLSAIRPHPPVSPASSHRPSPHIIYVSNKYHRKDQRRSSRWSEKRLSRCPSFSSIQVSRFTISARTKQHYPPPPPHFACFPPS